MHATRAQVRALHTHTTRARARASRAHERNCYFGGRTGEQLPTALGEGQAHHFAVVALQDLPRCFLRQSPVRRINTAESRACAPEHSCALIRPSTGVPHRPGAVASRRRPQWELSGLRSEYSSDTSTSTCSSAGSASERAVSDCACFWPGNSEGIADSFAEISVASVADGCSISETERRLDAHEYDATTSIGVAHTDRSLCRRCAQQQTLCFSAVYLLLRGYGTSAAHERRRLLST